MWQSYKIEFVWILYLVAIGILLHSEGSHAACADKSFDSPCICLDDVLCDGGHLLGPTHDCLCTNGIEGTLNSIAKECMKKNGRIRALYISGTDITSLEPLIGALEIVEHHLVVRKTGIESLKSINNLHNIGSLKIGGNDRLSDIGLGNVSKLSGDLLVFENWKLTDISGLEKLAEVDGNVSIESNGVANISGLSRMTYVGGSLQISSNNLLSNISGLSELTKVDGDMIIKRNDKLVNICLKSLTQVDGKFLVKQNQKLIGLGNKLEMVGSLEISENEALSSLDWLQDLSSIGGDVKIHENPQLQTLNGLQNILSYVNGSLSIVNNEHLEDLKALENVNHVSRDLVIQYSGGRVLSNCLNNIIVVGSDLKIVGLFILVGAFQKLESVGGDFFMSHSSITPESQIMTSLQSVERHMTFSDTMVQSYENFQNLKHVGGDLIIKESIFGNPSPLNSTPFTILSHVETVGGGLDINGNKFSKFPDNLYILPNLESICNTSTDSMCGLQIRSNSGYEFIRGFRNLSAFNGFLSITGNIGLYGVKGFLKTTSLKFTVVHARENVVSGGPLGALVLAFNYNLRSIDGFDCLVEVEGDLFIFQNPELDHIVLENLKHVAGFTQIVENGATLKAVVSTEPLPYSEPGCRSRQNTIPSFELSNGSAFLTALEYNECSVEKLVPTMVGISTICTIIIVSYLLFHYLFLSQSSSLANAQHIAERELRNMFGVHILALADVVSDFGFIITTFIVWQGQDPGKKDVRVLVIGILSTIVLVGCQLYVTISVCVGLVHKLPGCNLPLIENLRANDAMRRRDWLLLFPGLLVLETEVIKHLPWGRSIPTDDARADGFPHRYFARVASMAVLLEDFPQIVSQTIFIVVIEGSDGWAITGAIASLTLSVSDLIVKTAFPLLMKARTSYNPIIELPLSA